MHRCLFLFVWLPDAWLQQQPWQRGSWQAEVARWGTAPRCRPQSPTQRSWQGWCQAQSPPATVQVELTGGAQPLLSRLACPQIINPNAPAAFTKPHLINVPPHKYKLHPLHSGSSVQPLWITTLVGFVDLTWNLSAG